MIEIYIGLGTNWGKRLQNIHEAIERIKNIVKVERVSSLYLTQPVEVKGGWFVNCVLKGLTERDPFFLLEKFLLIEKEMGRKRGEKEKRTIDVDMLFYGDKVIKDSVLTIPHPRLHQRRFVLVPLVEVSPHFIHPVFKKSTEELLKTLKDPHRVEKIEES